MYSICFFFFNDTATTEIYTLSLHDALPIFTVPAGRLWVMGDHRSASGDSLEHWEQTEDIDRKSTRLNSSHANISYAVFCLKKKKMTKKDLTRRTDTKEYIYRNISSTESYDE